MIGRRAALHRGLGALAGAALAPGIAASLAGSALGAGPSAGARRVHRLRNGKLRLLQVGVGGSVAPWDRSELLKHPDVSLAGICDVDANALAAVRSEHPGAFACADWREALELHSADFDAVVVCVPDHNHAVIMLDSLRAGKHVYGQKPLVQQLSEVPLILSAARTFPELVTQTGNQRMGGEGRQRAVDILRRGLLGKAIDAHVWVGGPSDGVSYFFWYGGLPEPSAPPAHLNWELWLGCAQDAPYREGLAPLQWRSSWDYGSGQLGDWATHLLDVLYFAYGLDAPISVLSDTKDPSGFYHAVCVRSTLAYPGGGSRFARETFPVHYSDRSQAPSRAALGLPPGDWPGTATLVRCEDGILLVQPEGEIEVWRDGKPVDWRTIPGQGEVRARNHWHSWVDRILGKPDALVQTPFESGARLAEAGLLCSRAARFPGKELWWDRGAVSFTNSPEATAAVTTRAYRAGFQPPQFPRA